MHKVCWRNFATFCLGNMDSDDEFVINEKDMGIQITGKNGENEYIEKASFSIELQKHIDAGEDSGSSAKYFVR